MKKKHALILGGTGATGQELVKLLIKDSTFEKVSIFSRRKINIQNKKLSIHVIDFSRLDHYADLIMGDVLFSALGTTLADAGSKTNQYLVDFEYQYNFAKIAANNGIDIFSLVSSYGANAKSIFFYPKLKGMLEQKIKSLSFKNIQIFQPSFLIRQLDMIRPTEKIVVRFFNILARIYFFKSFKPIAVKDLALKMVVESKFYKNKKITFYEPKNLFNYKK